MVFKTDYRLVQDKSIQGEHSAILSTFIKLPYAIKIFVLSIFEWLFYTGFTVCSYVCVSYPVSLPLGVMGICDCGISSHAHLVFRVHLP